MTESARAARWRWRTAGCCAIWLGSVAPTPVFADALGDARLFFTRAERDLLSSAREGHEPTGSDPVDSAPARGGPAHDDPADDGPDESRRVARRPTGRGGSSRRAGAEEREADLPRAVARRRIGFDALLRVDERVRVIVGGGPCHRDRTGTELRCDRVPEGIESLALAPDGRRLVVTFDGGRRVRVGVGEAIVP